MNRGVIFPETSNFYILVFPGISTYLYMYIRYLT